jgi:hypothetical protein
VNWFDAPSSWLPRFLLTRALGGLYVIAFAAALVQFPALLGERGLLPAPAYLRRARFRQAPSVFQLGYSDRRLVAVAASGLVLGALTLVGLPQQGPVWLPLLTGLVLWALYLSIVNVGQTFYAFGWESLLCEAGFFAAFLGSDRIAPPLLVIVVLRWLVFRLEFGAGLIKLRGDRCWRQLTCLDYHHETQPMPNPLSWYFHHLPRWMHRVEVAANHGAQLVLPWLLFLPQPVAGGAALAIIVTQAWLVLSGNFAWLNALTITVAVAGLDDGWLDAVVPVDRPTLDTTPGWFTWLVIAVAALALVLSWWPARNLMAKRQMMNFSFNRYHLVNAYGAFGSITRSRLEVVVEGTQDTAAGPDSDWRAYGFKGKPGDPGRRPPQVAPYHLRLDWLMWFLALSPAYGERWFAAFLQRLLEADSATLRLLRHDPFDGRPPTFVRAVLYHYRFTTRPERRATGAWWHRDWAGELVSPVRSRSRR